MEKNLAPVLCLIHFCNESFEIQPTAGGQITISKQQLYTSTFSSVAKNSFVMNTNIFVDCTFCVVSAFRPTDQRAGAGHGKCNKSLNPSKILQGSTLCDVELFNMLSCIVLIVADISDYDIHIGVHGTSSQVSTFHKPRRPLGRVQVQLYSILDLCTRRV